ncbi:MAG: bifunctional folylpolyglutamate synthase/dihydrofolate synthase [Endomicrobium sp.]|jgi:dihydrofolate synthase/folylpolyglutamate synthase|nr:bifunctional folylpolyglutamate synthase/dihydrofolate synthase [Endomicrobium sp.]
MKFFETLKEYESMTLGLSRIKKFLKNIGNPQDAFDVIHIAGTNGKGSVSAFMSTILKSGGYKTAVYTSPHLVNITERIKINDKNISPKIFDKLSKKYLKQAIECQFSYFEYLTVLAFIYFAKHKVDIVVLETGLGGRFDATNVIKNPLACVITSIAKEHQEKLGDNIEKIAFEKAGIIKKNACIVCGNLPKKAIGVVENKSSRLHLYGKDFKALNNKICIVRQKFDYVSKNMSLKNIEIKLNGKHQVVNACVAICVANLLNKRGYCLNETCIKIGLQNTILPGRFDIRKIDVGVGKFKIIIDGAHNIQSLDTFIETFKQLGFAKKKRTFIFAVMKDKKYKNMLKKLLPFANKIILPRLMKERAVSPDILKAKFSQCAKQRKIYTTDCVKNALSMIKAGETAVSVGSFYLAGEILKIIE